MKPNISYQLGFAKLNPTYNSKPITHSVPLLEEFLTGL